MSAKIWRRHKHIFQNKNFARSKSHKKYQKALEWYATVLKKENKVGFEKWVANELVKVNLRFKKFGITKTMVEDYMSKRQKI